MEREIDEKLTRNFRSDAFRCLLIPSWWLPNLIRSWIPFPDNNFHSRICELRWVHRTTYLLHSWKHPEIPVKSDYFTRNRMHRNTYHVETCLGGADTLGEHQTYVLPIFPKKYEIEKKFVWWRVFPWIAATVSHVKELTY